MPASPLPRTCNCHMPAPSGSKAQGPPCSPWAAGNQDSPSPSAGPLVCWIIHRTRQNTTLITAPYLKGYKGKATCSQTWRFLEARV